MFFYHFLKDGAFISSLISKFHLTVSFFLQATLILALDILLSEESGLVDLQQGVGRLINAIVAVLGPELSPDSIFFSRCKVGCFEFQKLEFLWDKVFPPCQI